MINCHICNIVGKTSLNNLCDDIFESPKKYVRREYHLGNGNSTSDEGEAKDFLLKRDYVKIFDLKETTKDEFKPGEIGINILPEIYFSQMPQVIETQASWSRIKGLFWTPIEEGKFIETFKAERAELAVFDGIKNYFHKYNNEDVFVFFNQDFEDKIKRTWLERDALVVNCTRGYILVIEAKSDLTKKKLSFGGNQLKVTLKNVLQPISSNLNQKWDVYSILYGSNVDLSHVCTSCRKFVISKADGNFSLLLENILKNQSVKDWNYAQDFYRLIGEILPLRVRISKKQVSSFIAKKSILEKVSESVQEAGKPEVVAFWTRDQANLAYECLYYRRVLFDSSFSTGKTSLMIHCVEKLLEENQKVLFVIDTEGHPIAPSLLLFKIQNQFKQMYQNSPQENNIIVRECNLNEEGHFENLFKQHTDCHVFIDEIRFEYCIDYEKIKKWHMQINQNKHFWIAICYGKERFDVSQFFNIFFICHLEYPARNNMNTVELVKSRVYANASYAINDKTKIDELKIPSNLTRSFDLSHFVFEAKNYTDGLKKALTALEDISKTHPALIVVPWSKCSSNKWCNKCFDHEVMKYSQFKLHANALYQQIRRQYVRN